MVAAMRKSFALALILILLTGVSTPEDRVRPAGPLRNDERADNWARKTLKKMSLEEKVGQLFMVWARVEFLNVESPQYQQLRDAIRKYHLGGFGITVPVDGPFLLRNQPYEAASLTNQLQHESEVPLIFAADFERGLYMRLYGTTGFPHAMAFGAAGNKDYAFSFGQITAEEARAIGVHWSFFPDADVNSNPANPIINIRSFSEDPEQVSEMVQAYIAGAHGAGMMTTAKHFPGHGDTDTDTHLSLARVSGSRERLSQVELAPFRKAIDAGVDAVMVAHVSVPALESDPNKVASVSEAIITGQLRHRMGFDGIVVTDAMDMNGVMRLFPAATMAASSGRAAVEAIKAGTDMILIPGDLDGAYNGVLNAVRSKEIPESRINESVLRLLRAKASLGLDKHRYVDLRAAASLVARPENLQLAQKIADDAVTLVRDNGRVLPLKSIGTSAPRLPYTTSEESRTRVFAVIFSDDVRKDDGRVFERQLRARAPDATIVYVDSRTAAALSPVVLQTASQAGSVIAASYVAPSAGRTVRVNGVAKASVGMDQPMSDLLNAILTRAADKTMLVSLGNPYLAADFPEVKNYICIFSNAPVSEVSAVKALFGEIAIHGHLPITIPGIAARGYGLDRNHPAGGTQ